jgi:hypothetical protein
MAALEMVSGQLLSEADLVIRPSLRGIGFFDFQSKSTLVFKGKKAVQDQVAELRRLTGKEESVGQGGSTP